MAIQSPARSEDQMKNAADPLNRSQPIKLNHHSLRGDIKGYPCL